VSKSHRGRPKGISGQAPVLKPQEITTLMRFARSRERMPEKSAVALSIYLYRSQSATHACQHHQL
jgi:hypothetical protein